MKNYPINSLVLASLGYQKCHSEQLELKQATQTKPRSVYWPLRGRGAAKREINSPPLQKQYIILSSAAIFRSSNWCSSSPQQCDSIHQPATCGILALEPSPSNSPHMYCSFTAFSQRGKRLKGDKDKIKHEIVIDDKKRYDDSAKPRGRLKKKKHREVMLQRCCVLAFAFCCMFLPVNGSDRFTHTGEVTVAVFPSFVRLAIHLSMLSLHCSVVILHHVWQ